MNDDRDPVLAQLFDAAQRDFAQEPFTQMVARNIQGRQRRVLLGRMAILAMLVLMELLLESPLQHTLGRIGAVLSMPLVSIRHEWLAFLLAPVNSVAGLLGLVLIGTHFFYRRITH
jgi:hypothetical protein